MAEQLGKIEKPEAARFKQGKKLYLVPLIYSGEETLAEYQEKCTRYWQQVTEQLSNLASKIGQVKRIYHESIFQSGEDGMKTLQRLNPSSYQLTKTQYENGAILEAVEERELFEEAMDWQRCLMLGFISDTVANKVAGFYAEAVKRRNEFMIKKINETLKDSEAGLLFIREGHSVQFPTDIEVFSIFPPVLDEIHRWYRDQARLEIEKRTEESKDKTKGETDKVKKKTKKTTKREPKV